MKLWILGIAATLAAAIVEMLLIPLYHDIYFTANLPPNSPLQTQTFAGITIQYRNNWSPSDPMRVLRQTDNCGQRWNPPGAPLPDDAHPPRDVMKLTIDGIDECLMVGGADMPAMKGSAGWRGAIRVVPMQLESEHDGRPVHWIRIENQVTAERLLPLALLLLTILAGSTLGAAVSGR